MNKYLVLVLVFICILFILDYPFLDKFIINSLKESEYGKVERIVDGDTIIVDNQSVRLLGINTPERGELLYQEAKEFLEEKINNKTVRLEYNEDKYDKYGRKLAFVFLDNENINIKIVKQGFANPYILSYSEYNKYIRKAWQECIDNNKNLCEKSKDKCKDCIILQNINIADQEVLFFNNCSYDCNLTNWQIKDEGRKKLTFNKTYIKSNKEIKILVSNCTSSQDLICWNKQDYVWTKDGDTLFLRDVNGKLVLWYNY